MRTDVLTLNRLSLAALVLTIALAVIASLCGCGCDNDLDCAPDLRVESISVEQPVVPLEPADVQVVVWNRGVSGTGRGFRVALTSDGGLGYEWTIPPLPPRARATLDGFLVVLDDCALSSIDVTVVVDADDVVSEGCEANNSMTVSVVVGAIEEATP